MFFVYILKSLKDGKRYVGYTNNLKRRLLEHNSGICKSTSKRMPLVLIHSEEFEVKSEAMKRERFFKSGIGREYMKSELKLEDIVTPK
jgi:putative endonuclease